MDCKCRIEPGSFVVDRRVLKPGPIAVISVRRGRPVASARSVRRL